MENKDEIKKIVNIVKETVRGYYVIVKRDSNTYSIHTFDKKEFISIFSNGGEWKVEHDGDLTRFLLCDDVSVETASKMLKTFNAYEEDGKVKIAAISIVCDWSIFELAFNEKQPDEVLRMILLEKK